MFVITIFYLCGCCCWSVGCWVVHLSLYTGICTIHAIFVCVLMTPQRQNVSQLTIFWLIYKTDPHLAWVIVLFNFVTSKNKTKKGNYDRTERKTKQTKKARKCDILGEDVTWHPHKVMMCFFFWFGCNICVCYKNEIISTKIFNL